MRTFRNAMWMGLTIAGVSMAACSSGPSNTAPGSANTPPSDGSWGKLSAELQLAPGVTLSSVAYTITNPTLAGFTTITGTFDVSNSQGIGFSVALPAAGGYAVSISATDSNGDQCAGGPASFTVTGGQTATVGLTLQCTTPGDGGLVGPDVNPGSVIVEIDASLVQAMGGGPCAAVSSLVVGANRIDVGHSIPLSAAGVDPGFQSSDVTLTWAATGSAGSLSGTTGTSDAFSCTAPGNETVTVTASISNGGASCPGIGSLSVTLECDAPAGGSDAAVESSTDDAGPGSSTDDAGPDSSAVDAGMEASTFDAPSEATTGGGPLTACTVAPCTANQVTCSNNSTITDGHCTQTEADFVQVDIASGADVAGDAAQNVSSCYACLVNADCLDNGTHFSGRECEDFGASTFANASTTVDSATTCDAVVSCVISSHCAVADNSLCYCGTGGGPSSQCVTTAGGAAANGPCITQEVAGLPDAQTDTSDNVGTFYGTKADPSGRANDIFACALSAGCTTCL